MRSLIQHLLAAVIAIASAATAFAQTGSLFEIRELAAQSRYEEAYQRLESYLETRPADEQARLLKGVLLTRLERVDDAINVFRHLAEDNPNLAEPHNNLAVLLAAQGRFEEARQSLLQAIALRPDYAIARENLGDIYARLADIEYRRAHQIDRDNARAREKAETMATLFEPIEAVETAARPSPENAGAPESETPDPPSAAATASTASAPSPGCLVVTGMENAAAVDTLASWLGSRGARVIETGTREVEQITSYQIYVPPLPDRDQAKAQVANMKQSGVTDLYVIGSGSLKNGISLGIYVTESASGRRMAGLRDMGYEVRRRPRFETVLTRFVEADITAAALGEVDIRRNFPDYTAESSSCR